MNVPPTILLATCAILGLFILGHYLVALLWSPQDCTHNIGCYLTDRSLNKSAELEYRIKAAQHNHTLSHSKTYAYPSFASNESELHHNSLKLADTFEAYLHRFTQHQNDLVENYDIFQARRRAQSQYDNCRKAIERQFTEAECLQNWDDYELKCYARIDDVRGTLNGLVQEADIIRQKIKDWVKLPESSHSDVEWARKIYNERMENNTKHRDQLNRRMDKSRSELSLRQKKRDQAVEKSKLVNQSYTQCASKRKQFKACQEISKEVRSLNAQTLSDLKQMIEGKKTLLFNLREILKGQQDSKDMQHLNEVYKKQMEEYKFMMRQYISESRDTQKACGCTEEEEGQYLNQLQKLHFDRERLESSIRQLQRQLTQDEGELRKVQEEREEIFQAYKKAIQDSEGRGDHKGSQLERLNQELLNKNKEIHRLQSQYQLIFDDCDRDKARMAKRVHNIDAITDCLGHKYYYQKLLSQSQPYMNPANETAMIGKIRADLRGHLAAFRA